MAVQNQNSNPAPWWRNQSRDKLQERITRVHRINDPGTVADEVLKSGKLMMFLLLCFTGLLGALSYFKFFSKAFPVEVAWAMSAALTIAIEWGKNAALRWSVRIPLFQGFGKVFSTPADTFIWAGLVLVSALTFTISAYNSTKGSAELSKLLHREKTEQVFAVNTADLDQQITDAKQRIERNNRNTWKGVVIVESQRANRSETNLINKLQDEKAKRIEQQRADFERSRTISDEEGKFTSQSIMAAGGWVELFQILVIFVLCASEKKLDARNPIETAPTPSGSRIGFQWGNTSPAPTMQTPPQQPDQPRRPIGFVQYPSVPQRDTVQESVPQIPQPVAQINTVLKGKEADEAILYHLQRLQKEPGNFSNKHAQPKTVANRIHSILTDLEDTLNRVEQCQVETLTKTAGYISKTIIPSLQTAGYPYDMKSIYNRLNDLLTRFLN